MNYNNSDTFIAYKSVKIPLEMYTSLKVEAKYNARTIADELIARLDITLSDQEIMSRIRLMRLIFSSKLAYKGHINFKKNKNKSK
jgi:hypothetical protein